MSAFIPSSSRRFRTPIYIPNEREGLTGIPGNMMHFTDSVLNKQKSPKSILTLPFSKAVQISSKHNTIVSPHNSVTPENPWLNSKSKMAKTGGFQRSTPSPPLAFRQSEGPTVWPKNSRSSRIKEKKRMAKFNLDGEEPDISLTSSVFHKEREYEDNRGYIPPLRKRPTKFGSLSDSSSRISGSPRSDQPDFNMARDSQKNRSGTAEPFVNNADPFELGCIPEENSPYLGHFDIAKQRNENLLRKSLIDTHDEDDNRFSYDRQKTYDIAVQSPC